MGIAEIVIGKVQVILYVIVGIFLIISVFSYLSENQEQNIKMGQDTIHMIKNTAPDVINAAQTVCNLDEIVLSEIKTNEIDKSMLGWSTNQTNKILEKWATTDKVETCEVVLMNELLGDSETENNWRNKIGLNKAIKNQACTVIECFDKYGVIEYLKKQKEN